MRSHRALQKILNCFTGTLSSLLLQQVATSVEHSKASIRKLTGQFLSYPQWNNTVLATPQQKTGLSSIFVAAYEIIEGPPLLKPRP